MGLISVNLDPKEIVLLPNCLSDLPFHCIGGVCGWAYEYDCTARPTDSFGGLRLPCAIKGVLDRVVDECYVVPRIARMLDEKVPSPLVFHLKADERARRCHSSSSLRSVHEKHNCGSSAPSLVTSLSSCKW